MKRNVRLHLFLAALFVIFFCCNKQQQSTQRAQTEVQNPPPQQAQQQAPAQQPPAQPQTETAPPVNATPSPAAEPVEQNTNSSAPDSSSAQSPSMPEQSAESNAPNFRMPAFWENPDAAGLLPPTLDPATVLPEAQAAYLIAQQKPKLLAQMPCFCYCDRFGHKSLHDCYVSTHAEHCDVCLQEAIEADQYEKQGMSPEEIRAVIVAKHHPPS